MLQSAQCAERSVEEMKRDLSKFRTWVEIDLGALEENFEAIKGSLPAHTGICAVVKADAYGHGAIAVTKALSGRCRYFAVAMAEEAYELRRAGVDDPILVLGIPPVGQYEGLIKSDVTLTVPTGAEGLAIAQAAKRAGKRAKVHIALDTGMGRIGFLPSEEQFEEICALFEIKELEIEGIFSHFACADAPDGEFSADQQALFDSTVRRLKARGYTVPLCHIYNSAATCTMNSPHDMVREGILLYGISPLEEGMRCPVKVRPVMTMKSRVIQVKTVPPQTVISYGSTYRTRSETVVATLSAGYGDGVPRLLSNKGYVIVKGQYAPIIGRVCMDQLMIDATHVEDLQVGQEAVLFGCAGKHLLGADQVMASCGGIAYELLCNVNRRVPRVYLKNGEVESISNILPESEDL